MAVHLAVFGAQMRLLLVFVLRRPMMRFPVAAVDAALCFVLRTPAPQALSARLMAEREQTVPPHWPHLGAGQQNRRDRDIRHVTGVSRILTPRGD